MELIKMPKNTRKVVFFSNTLNSSEVNAMRRLGYESRSNSFNNVILFLFLSYQNSELLAMLSATCISVDLCNDPFPLSHFIDSLHRFDDGALFIFV